jgi:hypothetical protein
LYAANSTEVNSSPRSVLNTRSFFPLGFYTRLEALARQELQPHVAAAIIHEQDEVLAPAVRRRRDWPAEVAID